MKFYLPTLKHLVIQLAKLQIYTLNLTTTFWHCKKTPITFEQECTCKWEFVGIEKFWVYHEILVGQFPNYGDAFWAMINQAMKFMIAASDLMDMYD